jgi:hypothetical protein
VIGAECTGDGQRTGRTKSLTTTISRTSGVTLDRERGRGREIRPTDQGDSVAMITHDQAPGCGLP